MKNSNIYLVGFMGTGKTTAARRLASATGIPCLEMDDEIEKRAGCPITEIFRSEGEAGFRRRETAVLRDIAADGPYIVSCGGGAVLIEENVRIMKESGTVFLLTASPETVLARVSGSTHRPILKDHMDLSYIRQLLEKRQPFYQRAADRIIVTDHRSIEEITEELLKYLPGFIREE